MRTLALVVACLACTGLASRAQRDDDRKRGSIRPNSNRATGFLQPQSSRPAGACSSLNLLEILLLGVNPRATFNPSGSGSCFRVFDAIHQTGVYHTTLSNLVMQTRDSKGQVKKRSDEWPETNPVMRDIVDPYKLLNLTYDATPAQIKKAHQKATLWLHPDRPHNRDKPQPEKDMDYMKARAAFLILKNPELKMRWDRKLKVGPYARSAPTSSGSYSSSTSSGSYRSPYSSSTSSSSRRFDDPLERFQNREEIPTPDELGDSFGALFNDFANAVAKAAVGSGGGSNDWSSIMNEFGGMDQSGLESLLLSRDRERLENELESTKLVQDTLKSRIERLKTAVSDTESDLQRIKSPASSSMSRSFQYELEKDLRRQREQLTTARRSLEQSQTNAERIQLRIAELARGGGSYSGTRSSSYDNTRSWSNSGSSYGNGGSSYRGSSSTYGSSSTSSGSSGSAYGGSGSRNQRRSVPSVEEELAQLKKRMGK